MLFNKNDDRVNERVLYQAKPNMLLGCKKAIFGLVMLAVVLVVSPTIIQFIGDMQVYMISYVKLSLTRYAAIAFFIVILIIVIYIIWQLVAWHSVEYTLTDTRIIIKSGVLSTKKSYMPYATIQDVNTSQGIVSKMFNVGSVSVFSAYDNNLMKLSNISNPSKVEEIIFSHITAPRNFQRQAPIFNPQSVAPQREYYEEDEYYDEFEPITPITHERYSGQKREYEYYPEDSAFTDRPRHSYEYEPYDEIRSFRNNDDAMSPNRNSRDSYYNEVRNEYSYADEEYYPNYEREYDYDESPNQYSQNAADDVAQKVDDSQETAIRRHFDKFKR